MKNPVIIIKVGRTVIGETRESQTVNDAKRKFCKQYPGYDTKSVTAHIKHAN